MMKRILQGLVVVGLLTPFAAFASVTINSVTINGSTGPVQVQPGDNITVAITATLTDKSKWKGINWGLSTDGSTPICVNTKNAKDGTRNNSAATFTETFTIKAPAEAGTYNANFSADLANNCGQTASSLVVLPQTVVVGNAIIPTIDAHDDITVYGTASGATVTYTAPSVKDQNGNVVGTASCAPASGGNFVPGTTHVTCTYPGATEGGFNITVIPPGTPVVLSTQTDASTLCSPDWRECYTGGLGSPERAINLGSGAQFGNASLLSVTIAKDETSPFVDNPWVISVICYTDSAYTNHCPDWVTPNAWNANQPYVAAEFATTTTDHKFFTAYFTNPTHESNYADNSAPVTFNPNYYYQLLINDNGWEIGAYGSATTPYYVLKGTTL